MLKKQFEYMNSTKANPFTPQEQDKMAAYAENFDNWRGPRGRWRHWYNLYVVYASQCSTVVGFATKTLDYSTCSYVLFLAIWYKKSFQTASHAVFLSVQRMLKISGYCNLKNKHWAQSRLINVNKQPSQRTNN